MAECAPSLRSDASSRVPPCCMQVRNANESIDQAMESLEQANAASEARASGLEASRRALEHDKEELLRRQAELRAQLEEAQLACEQQTARANDLEAEKTRLAGALAVASSVVHLPQLPINIHSQLRSKARPRQHSL